MPGDSCEKVEFVCQKVPLMEYSSGERPLVAVMVIAPSLAPQSEISFLVKLMMVAETGCVSVSAGKVLGQVPPTRRTRGL